LNQHAWQILNFKVALVVVIIGCVIFVLDSTRLTRWKIWKDPIGQTLVIKDIFIIGQTVPLMLVMLVHFSAFASEVATWVFIGFYYLVGLLLLWRTYVFERENEFKRDRPKE
jgi:hypothetical protein